MFVFGIEWVFYFLNNVLNVFRRLLVSFYIADFNVFCDSVIMSNRWKWYSMQKGQYFKQQIEPRILETVVGVLFLQPWPI